MRGKKIYAVLAGALVLLILGISTYNYIYKGHRDIATERVAHTVSAEEIHNDLGKEGKIAKYVDQVVQLHGKITALEQNAIVIDNKVQINFLTDTPNDLSIAGQITIKGRCVGYDDLLELVKIDQATLIHNN
ncbi:hypothetical protein [Ulvibacterium sp.]|uniref:hypothetical protein n=1 Tax=Ulvibacterium sp. TaxID=2665914 RepID=UPI0026312036|nr:hypothetical protein [Ulvibacterium sp.]